MPWHDRQGFLCADGQLASLLSEHGLDWIPPKFCDFPRGRWCMPTTSENALILRSRQTGYNQACRRDHSYAVPLFASHVPSLQITNKKTI